ncbi:MAG: hypothetical protein ACRDOU_26540 [Streptosporangiaceae bacterium]
MAPLFYGMLGCLGLFIGARRWLGRFGGAAAVGLFCSSGAALLFAWQDYWPTFTDASLIAAGTCALLWALLADEATARRRTWLGLLGFASIEAAVFVRYTNIVVLGCAVIAVLALRWRRPGSLPRAALGWWLGSVALFGTGVAIFDDLVYGGPLRSGYRPGEVTFSLAAVSSNLRYVPAHLIQAMPMLVLGLAVRGPYLVRGPRRAPLAAAASVVVVAMFALGAWSFNDMLNPQNPGPPAPPHCNIGEPHCQVPVPRSTGQNRVRTLSATSSGLRSIMASPHSRSK